jgi:flagellin-like protein
MNVFGQSARSWRKAQKRAVSPIIATILLVAITVVLAAVLYVLISGLTHGPGSTPIGSAFTAGNPTTSNTIGTGAAEACAAGTTTVAGAILAHDWTYTLTIESSTVTFGSVLFQVKAASGSVAAPAGYQGFFVVNIAGNVVACALTAGNGGLSMGGSVQFTYTTGGALTATNSLSNIYTIVIDMGTVQPTGAGNTFDALGQGSYSGTTAGLALP